ncbi:SOS response-associated peptidase [Hyphomicrobium sp. LHD-15]|uniref:SOS response-associated peptidase n=1 Tax=Hyphomicrobium sp. LHD-15 TaxID=3072142 RepID=UPI00280FC759|nr:SOS response-associated peptidase [Hyphomicrobium sp. LHD-15]MDQ8700215.1 SOS response-associated peptidase [Hyphomicrobium sp. LHD-15]
MGSRNDDRLECTPEELVARRAEFERRLRITRRTSPSPERTLAEIRSAGGAWFWLYCEVSGCGRCAALPLTPLIIRWGREALRSQLLTGFRCTRCGGRRTTVRWPNSDGKPPFAYPPIDEHYRWTGTAVWPEPLSMHYLADKAMGAGEIDYSPVLGSIRFGDMCNLYSNTKTRDALRGAFKISDNRAYAFEPMPAIFPKAVAPVVRVASDGERELVPMTWGFPLLRKGYAPKPVTNVRDDTVLTSPFWRPSFEARRCLVPASSYCEPDSNSPAGWHWFALNDGIDETLPYDSDARSLFAFPGIWKRYRGPMKKDGEPVEVDVYAFMTTSPNALTATIMHDRMPVLLSEPEDFETWLTGSPEAAYSLVRTYPAERMRIVQSGMDKQDLLGVSAEQML